MFGERMTNRLTERVDRCIADGILASHPTDPKRGERYSKLVEPETGLQVDLFSATAATFGLILLIRTGPADYSHRFVTAIRGRPALHVAGGELHRGSLGCGAYACEVVPTPEEADVYAAADWPFREPELRG
jgi:DNA polymerase/3'-5' exonuclease PolX